jgi:hypothetical protein
MHMLWNELHPLTSLSTCLISLIRELHLRISMTWRKSKPGSPAMATPSQMFTVTLEETAVAITASSATSSDFDDAATVQAQLTPMAIPSLQTRKSPLCSARAQAAKLVKGLPIRTALPVV